MKTSKAIEKWSFFCFCIVLIIIYLIQWVQERYVGTIISVSYTHLDVYKRQVHDEEFDKLVSGSDDRDMMDSVEASVEESILQDAETVLIGSSVTKIGHPIVFCR